MCPDLALRGPIASSALYRRTNPPPGSRSSPLPATPVEIRKPSGCEPAASGLHARTAGLELEMPANENRRRPRGREAKAGGGGGAFGVQPEPS
jgi:hypothetical protein